jgi:hypothetical protein
MDCQSEGYGFRAITRRSALLALSVTAVSPVLMAQESRAQIRTRRLNNVMIAVSNLERSVHRSAKAMSRYFASARGRTFLP